MPSPLTALPRHPAAVNHSRLEAAPTGSRHLDHHHLIRRDVIDSTGKVTLRHGGRLYHIGVGRTHARTPVIMLVHDLDVRVVDAVTGKLLKSEPSPSTPRGRTSPPAGHPDHRLDS